MRYLGPVLLDRGACPYLPGRTWRSVSLEVEKIDPAEFQVLLEGGYRRCGTEFYVPRCEGCSACVPLRIPVQRFRPGKTQRRVFRRNADLQVEIVAPGYTAEKLDLYQRFLEGRFDRGGRTGKREFEYFLGFHFGNSVEIDYRLDGRLVGFGILDTTPEAASSVYFAFDPELEERRLGTYSLMYEIDWCRRTGRKHLYLGLWVRDCRAMRYKSDFRPHEVLVPGQGWHEVPQEDVLLVNR